jgi:hypothetical protein
MLRLLAPIGKDPYRPRGRNNRAAQAAILTRRAGMDRSIDLSQATRS